jgi:predicted alpha/beta superfamily hydrolase
MALNALQIDFHSAIRDRGYRLLVPIPARPAPAQGYPVVWLIDGNLHFGITVDTMHIQACWPDVRDAVIVGIGYPTDRVTEVPRRFVWNPTVRIGDRRRARWACGQVACRPVHMSTGRV